MGYKWKPSKSQAKEFAQKMNNDSEFADAWRERKAQKAEKNRAKSEFDYHTAGGEYIPTEHQRWEALKFLCGDFMDENALTDLQKNACEMVVSCYDMGIKVHHDQIHIVNELTRNSGFNLIKTKTKFNLTK